jgi:ABC-type transport system involved in multi-copper enzyme maturation permease subunit
MIYSIFRYEVKYQFKNIILWSVSLLLLIFLYTEVVPYALYYPVKTQNDLVNLQKVGAAGDFRVKSTDTEIKNEIKTSLENRLKDSSLTQKEKASLEVLIRDINQKSSNDILKYFEEMPDFYESVKSIIEFNTYRVATLAEVQSMVNDKLRSERFSAYFARRYCDRLAVFACFIILFLFAFTFDRDRRSNINEILYTKPVKSTEYIIGKYLGVLLPFLMIISFITIVVGLFMYFRFTNFGWQFNPVDIYKSFLLWVCVSVIFSGALITALSLLLRNGIATLPLYLVYYIFMVKPSMDGGVWGYPIDLAHFMIRWDNFFKPESGILSTLIIQNRVLYLLLAFLFIIISIILWEKNRGSIKGVIDNAYKRLIPSAKI